MDTKEKIYMWCVMAIMMREEEYKIFKGILLGAEHTEQRKRIINNTISFIEKMREP